MLIYRTGLLVRLKTALCILASLGISLITTDAHAQWAHRLGPTGYTGAWARAIDVGVTLNDDVFVVGEFNGPISLDPRDDVLELSSSQGTGLFLASYDESGNRVWGKVIEGTEVWAEELAVSADAVFITGFVRGNIDFDPGPGIQSPTVPGAFLAKYNFSGVLEWAFVLENTRIYDVIIDPDGDIVVAGKVSGEVDIDPGPAEFPINQGNTAEAGFVARYSASGSYQSSIVLTSDDKARIRGVAVADDRNLFVTGWYRGTVDFDPSPAVHSNTASGSDIFISKYDAAGMYINSISIGGNDQDNGYAIIPDNEGGIYVAGWFNWTADFDPSDAVYELHHSGAYVGRYDGDLSFTWVRQFQRLQFRYDLELLLSNETVVLAGYLNFPLVITDEPIFPDLQNSEFRTFIVTFSPDGVVNRAVKLGGGHRYYKLGLASGTDGSIYISGEFGNYQDFDPDPQESSYLYSRNLNCCGSGSGFLAKYPLGLTGPIAVKIQDGQTPIERESNFYIYPNPSIESITLDYLVNRTAWVNISIYDTLGRPVREALSSINGPGRHSETIDVSGLPNGVYFCRITVGDESITKTVTIVH